MHRLESFTTEDERECADALRGFARGATSMEQVARRVVGHLYETLVDDEGSPACALVRLYKTHPFGGLEPELRTFAAGLLDGEPDDSLRCLTLLASAGTIPAWNDRRRSVGHRAIPLASAGMVERLPMVAQLFRQLGIDVGALLAPERAAVVELARQSYDEFHVPEALGSPYIPAQEEFVIPYAIRSAVGFGGILHSGDLYAVVAFSRVPVSTEVARTLKILALPLRVALRPFVGRRVFAAAT